MFWRFGGYANISSVDTLLDKPDVSLEELLDEPELISELKQHNTKLIEYLREDHILKKLLDYVIAPPLINDEDNDDDDNDDASKKPSSVEHDTQENEDKKDDILEPEDLERTEKQRSKFAYVACEILSSETWSILESIMLNEAYLREFWDFMKRPAPLDTAQAGYFTKVNEVLFDKKTEEMLEFFKSLKGIVPDILQHVDNPMVMDLLLKIVSLEKVEGGQGIVDWLKDEDLIPVLLSYISSEHPSSIQTSAGDFLKAIITISANATQNEQSCIGPNSLTRQLVSAPCVEQLIQFMLQGGNSLTVGVGIVIEVIRKNNSDYDENIGGPDTSPSIYDPIYLGTLLRQFSKHIPDFMTLILSSRHSVVENGQLKIVDRGQLNSAWGVKIEPLGFDRFKTCELMAELLHCSNMGLLNEVGSEDYIRQRDTERENLRAQGAFDPNRKDVSGMAYNENAEVSQQGYRIESQAGIQENANASDDDGFEDVGSSRDLDSDTKKTEPAEQPEAEKIETQPQAPGLLVEDSIVEESLSDSVKKPETGGPAPTESSIDPTSPSASGLTDIVGGITLGKDSQGSAADEESKEQAQQSPASSEDTPAAPSTSTSQPDPQGVEPTPDESPNTSNAPTEEPLNESHITQIEDEFAPQIQYDPSGEPVVGDFLKIQFVEHKVVPTILDFFFRFPWNNFLHNVVYDVVQQVFNGSMDRGFNRSLAIDLFNAGRITEKIVEGQKHSDEAQAARNMRLGYMGHLTLIAEEVVKFTERHPAEILSQSVMDKVLHADWVDYVERTLSETRERDNAILGGVRPDIIGHRQAVMNAVQGFTGSNALANAGLTGGNGSGGFENFDSMTHGSASSGAFGLGGSNSLLSGFGSSSDDEDEEMEDQEDDDTTKGFTDNLAENGSENVSASSSTSQPIPILAPPPAPLNIVPSRARRQLAARLALHKQQADAAAQNSEDHPNTDDSHQNDGQWQSNPFIIADLEDDSGTSPELSSAEFATMEDTDRPSSPTFHTGFTPPGSPSTNSSDEAGGEPKETVRRKVRVPLEVDDDDDDDEMGEMVGPSGGSGLLDSDEEEEAIINESLGYSNFFGANRYGGFRSYGRNGQSSFDDDDDDDDSSDGEDGLVEILVPGRKSFSSN